MFLGIWENWVKANNSRHQVLVMALRESWLKQKKVGMELGLLTSRSIFSRISLFLNLFPFCPPPKAVASPLASLAFIF